MGSFQKQREKSRIPRRTPDTFKFAAQMQFIMDIQGLETEDIVDELNLDFEIVEAIELGEFAKYEKETQMIFNRLNITTTVKDILRGNEMAYVK